MDGIRKPQNQILSAIDGLVDIENGTIDARIFSDPDLYSLEMEKIFCRTWQLLGHVDQIPKFGDYLLASIGEDSVVVTRRKDKSIGAFLNQCRHRGNPLVRADRGNAKTFTCSYHGWCHDLEGDLVSVPQEKTAYHCALNKSEWGAIQVPRVEIYKGLIFGNWDADAVDIETYLGDAAWYLDSMIDRNEGVELCGPYKWRVPVNWKWPSEQHSTDFFHAPSSHASIISLLNPSETPPLTYEALYPGEEGYQYADPSRGHATAGFVANMDAGEVAQALTFPPSPAWEYFNVGVKEIARKNLGEIRTDHLSSLVMNIFPNFSINMNACYIRVWQPRGLHEIEVMGYGFVDKGATDEEKAAFMAGLTLAFAPSGIFEQDDTENLSQCHKGVQGHMARQSRLNMQMGIGREFQHEDYKGSMNHMYSEHGARAFYTRWRDLLLADND